MLLLQDGLHLDLLQWMRSPLKQPIRTKHRFFLSFSPPPPLKQSEDAGEQAARGFVLFQSSYIFSFLFSFGERCEDASSFPEECFNWFPLPPELGIELIASICVQTGWKFLGHECVVRCYMSAKFSRNKQECQGTEPIIIKAPALVCCDLNKVEF